MVSKEVLQSQVILLQKYKKRVKVLKAKLKSKLNSKVSLNQPNEKNPSCESQNKS